LSAATAIESVAATIASGVLLAQMISNRLLHIVECSDGAMSVFTSMAGAAVASTLLKPFSRCSSAHQSMPGAQKTTDRKRF